MPFQRAFSTFQDARMKVAAYSNLLHQGSQGTIFKVLHTQSCAYSRGPCTVFSCIRDAYFIVSVDLRYLFMMSRVKAPFSKCFIPRFVRIHEALKSVFMYLRYLSTVSRVNGAIFQMVHTQRCAYSVFKWSFKGLASPRCQFKFRWGGYILVKSFFTHTHMRKSPPPPPISS